MKEPRIERPEGIVVFVGNSRVAGFGNAGMVGGPAAFYANPNPMLPGADQSPPCQVLNILGPSLYYGVNRGKSSAQIDHCSDSTDPNGYSLLDGYPADVSTHIRDQVRRNPATPAVVLLGDAGGNALYFSARGGVAAQREVQTAILAYAARVRADGALFVIAGITPRTPAGSSNPHFAEDCAAINRWIEGHWRSFANGVSFVHKDWRLSDYRNTTYVRDGTHYTDVGAALVAEHYAEAIFRAFNALVDRRGGSNGSRPGIGITGSQSKPPLRFQSVR